MSHYNSEQAAQLRDIGQYLQQQRLSQSLTLEEVADETFIRLAVLRSLENGEIDQLPERVYVQGFIRRYGDLLGLDGEELAHTLRDIPDELPVSSANPQSQTQEKAVSSPQPARSSTQTLSPPAKPSKSSFVGSYYRGIGQLLPIALGLAILGGLGGFFFTRRPADEGVVTNTSSSPIEVSPSPSPSPVVQISPTIAPSPSPVVTPEVPLSLSVQITERSWLKVTTDGTTAYEGILTEGEQKTWTAQQEIRLQTGNAGGVKVSVNDDPLEALGKSGEVKTANFKAETW